MVWDRIESTPLKEVTSASKGCQYMELHLPQSSVVVVDDKDKLKDCHTTVVQVRDESNHFIHAAVLNFRRFFSSSV